MKYTINTSSSSGSRPKAAKNRFSTATGRKTARKSFRPSVTRSRPLTAGKPQVKARNWGVVDRSGLAKKNIFSRLSKNSNRSAASTGKAVGGRKAQIKKNVRKFLTISVIAGFFIALMSAIGLGIYLQSLERSLPDPDRLISYKSEESTILYDRNGVELYKFYDDQNREFVSIDKIPEHTRFALLAAEDIDFESHEGLDWKGLVFCGISSTQAYLTGGASGATCGASTLSQQLTRITIMYEVFGAEAFERDNFFKAVRRKLREMLLTMQVEQNFTKDEILQLYMNEVPLGGVNYGFQSASKAYFGKDVSQLTLAESAMLSGIISNPSRCAPVIGTDPECAKRRQEYVFSQLEKHSDVTGIDKKEIDAAREEEIVYRPAKIDIKAPHFVFYVRDELEKEFGAEKVLRGGLRVTTTLDLATQEIAQEEVTNGTAQYGASVGVYNGAMVVIDPKTNQIISMVGSVDYNNEDPKIDGEVNVTTNLRQMGSSVKPYVYLAAFEKYGPYLMMPDLPQIKFANYNPQPKNWDNGYMGVMDMRKALVESRNIPAIYTLEMIGIPAGIEMMQRVGITAFDQPVQNYGLSTALGSKEMKLLEHTAGYSTFASGGIKKEVTSILKVSDSRGEVLKEYKDSEGQRIISEEDAYMLNWILCDIGRYGDTANDRLLFVNGVHLCSKTGTTDGPTDIVAMVYHKNLVVGMWNGNNDNTMFPGGFGSNITVPIVANFMNRVSGKYPAESFSRPAGVQAVTVCRDTGRTPPANADCPKVSTVSAASRLPKQDTRTVVEICKANGKIADNAEQIRQFNPDLLEKRFVLDFELENKNHQSQYEEYLRSAQAPEGAAGYLLSKPETARCDVPLGPNGAPLIDITAPGEGSTLSAGSTINIKANAIANGPIKSVDFYFDNTLIAKDTEAPYEINYAIPGNTSNGDHQIKARAIDQQNKTSEDTITIKVTGGTNEEPNDLTITITSPTNGSEVTKPVNIQATVAGGTAQSVRFNIRKKGFLGSDENIIDNNGANGWGTVWNPAVVSPGDQYVIRAYAMRGGEEYVSQEVTITF